MWRRYTRLVIASLLPLLGFAPGAHAQEGQGDVAARAQVDRLEHDLAVIEHGLALEYRDLAELALRERELRRAGVALNACEGHLAMAQRMLHGEPVDGALLARIDRHARVMAYEQRILPGLREDLEALERALADAASALEASARARR